MGAITTTGGNHVHITNTRIVGLIAVVCAAIVAPQALAMPIIDSQDATSTIIAPPGDDQGYDLSGIDPSVLNGIRGHQQQQEYLNGLASAALARGTTKSVKVQPESQWRSPLGQPANNTPGGIVRTSKSGTAASTAAAIKALQRRSVALDAAYRKLYPGAYRQAAPKSSNATAFVDNPLGDLKSGRVVFTAATHKSVNASTFGYMPTNPGWGAAATAAKESAAALTVKTAPLGWFCFDQAKYEYVHKACE